MSTQTTYESTCHPACHVEEPVQEGWVNEVVGADEKMQTKPS